MAILLDTNVAIDHFGGDARAVQLVNQIAGLPIYLSWVTLAELYEGAYASANPSAKIVAIRATLSEFDVLHPTDEIAVQFAEIRSFLRRRGQTVENFALLIAATALVHNPTLITFNQRHFERIPDLWLDRFQ